MLDYAEASKHILDCSYLIAALSLSMNAVLFRLARLPLSAVSHYMVRLKRNRLFQSQKSDRFVRHRQSGGSVAGVLPQMPSAAFEIGVVRLRLMMRPMLVKINHGCFWLLGKPCAHKPPDFHKIFQILTVFSWFSVCATFQLFGQLSFHHQFAPADSQGWEIHAA